MNYGSLEKILIFYFLFISLEKACDGILGKCSIDMSRVLGVQCYKEVINVMFVRVRCNVDDRLI